MSDDSAVEAARRIVSEFEEPGRNGCTRRTKGEG